MAEDRILTPEEQERLKAVIDYAMECLRNAREKSFQLSVYRTKGGDKIQLLNEDIGNALSELQHIRRVTTGLSSYEEPDYKGPRP